MKTPAALASMAATVVLAAPTMAQDPDLFDTTKVRSFYLTFKQSNWWNLLVTNKRNKIDIKADLSVDGKTYKDVGVRFKGNTSYSYNPSSQKKPFNIRIDSFVPGQSLYGYENLNLQNSYKDATFVREVIGYETMRRYIPSVNATFIKLYLNNEYWGIYILVQQLNKRFLGANFKDNNGNLYRGDAPGRNTRPVFLYWGENVSSYSWRYDYKTVGHPKPWVDLIALCKALNTPTLAQLPSQLPAHMEVDSALFYIALNNILANTDSYLGTGNDYFAYHDEHHDNFQIMAWDLNTVFGGYDWARLLGTNIARMSPYYAGGSRYARPLVERMLAVPEWKERYLAHLRTMLDEFFDWKHLGPIVTKYQKLIEADVKADTKKLYATQLFYDNAIKDVQLSDRYGTYTIPGLKSFVDIRRAYLLAHPDIKKVPPTASNLSHAPVVPTDKQTVLVTVKVSGASKVILHNRVVGVFRETQMYDDGKHGDGGSGDGVYGATLPAQAPGVLVQYYVGATASNGAMRFLPSHAGMGPQSYRVLPVRGSSAVIINEVLADNETVDQDEAKDYDDWIEIHNKTNAAYDLSGHYLSDDFNNQKKWQIPANTVLPANGFVRIWADEEPTEGKLHANFKLNKNGEEIGLYDTDARNNKMLDAMVFGAQKADRSYGSVPDGSGEACYIWEPSGNGPVTGTGPGRAVRFDKRRTGSTNKFDLEAKGTPKVSNSFSLVLEGGRPNEAAVLGLSLASKPIDLGPFGPFLLDQST
ncbi:MAG: CotH kinase family protein, partial [Planctomycetota bacterium]